VQVFRDGEAKTGYQMVKAPRKVAFLLASSVESPPHEPKGRSFVLNAESRSLLEAKVSAILSAGIEKGHDAIVISAFGCGYNKVIFFFFFFFFLFFYFFFFFLLFFSLPLDSTTVRRGSIS
jgi:hypothetical protein